MNIKFLLVSVIIHLIPFYFLISNKKQQKQQPESRTVEFSKKEPIRVRINPTRKIGHTSIKPQEATSCGDYYYGLGYQKHLVSSWCVVDEVADNSPMAKEGVIPGDKVLIIGNDCPGLGPDNTQVSVTIEHNGIQRTVTLTRAKICTVK